MFSRIRLLRSIAVVSAVAVVAGCGSLTGDGGDADEVIVVGTTSAPSVLDPAGAWDGSWELYRNIYQSLLNFPNSSGTPEPDAAKNCGFTDNASQVYRCTLKEGLKFSNGNKLDAAAVKFSVERTLKINAATGPAQLLESLDRVETSGDDTVVFHLKKPNATFPLVLATPAASIVDPASYPADKLRDKDGITGSGPYRLNGYDAGKQAELVKNDEYRGAAKLKNNAVTIRYFKDSARLVKAIEDGDVDLSFRGLTPEQITTLENAKNKDSKIKLNEATGTEIRYLVFNPDDPSVEDPAVREAIAQLIDRKALVREVYQRTAEPLYSMVPGGITGHTSAFYDKYGEPSQRKAKSILTSAGITDPVELTLWYTTDRYGATTKAEFEEIRRQLNGSGLFRVTIEGREWNEFQQAYQKGEYPVFGRGWFPDFPDADNYIGPFVGKHNALGIPYEDAELTGQILPASRQQSDRAAAGSSLKEAQRILAEDARLLPLWQGRVYIAAHEEIAGVEWAIDASTIMRMWELHRKSSW
ncbi:ABC transporter substrate-binding protein [Streptomyces sp. 549]|uniref:ABC transporter substrate-binding protein n=1 Tax=Streptomyces sp. 549 TaxID=3049076 RepID=UPI0024C3F5E7|nr:ABC transporter substrate-binding protein [Streptomyces sp. 549]MDK1474512.1 ABC transporter substrate-binding protein [Streptomyces sp. 549]